MHPSILGAGLLTTAALAAGWPVALQAACPSPQAATQERFISADCADCWAAAGPVDALDADARTPRWRFDWITPGTVDAPLAAAALVDASERAARSGGQPAPGAQRQMLHKAQRRLYGFSLKVESGPAWQGYIGVQLRAQHPRRNGWPAGSTAWLALVELLPAGSEGSAVERALVRAVAGPLPLTDAPAGPTIEHLHALRWPTTALPVRLQARGWIEGPDGALLAVAADRCR
jgi:hypothetical protein